MRIKIGNTVFWGAHACGVLVSAFCGDELLVNVAMYEDVTFEKVRDGRMPSPARCKRALPGKSLPREGI
jgi:hypothetical protein